MTKNKVVCFEVKGYGNRCRYFLVHQCSKLQRETFDEIIEETGIEIPFNKIPDDIGIIKLKEEKRIIKEN